MANWEALILKKIWREQKTTEIDFFSSHNGDVENICRRVSTIKKVYEGSVFINTYQVKWFGIKTDNRLQKF